MNLAVHCKCLRFIPFSIRLELNVKLKIENKKEILYGIKTSPSVLIKGSFARLFWIPDSSWPALNKWNYPW